MRNIIAIIVILVIIFLLYKRRKKNQSTDQPQPDQGLVQDTVLGLGSSGLDVKRLQMKLNEMIARAVNEEIPVSYSLDGYTYHPITQPLVVDGKFGKATQTMLFALTGKMKIKASEIDSLSISFPV
jgi:hypothetical protein